MGFVGRAAKRGGMHMTRKLLSLPLILITTAVTMAFGFYSDRPYAVNPNPKAEPLQERLSQWAGAGFWLVVSFVLALTHPLWGLPAVLFAAFVVMRRIAASRGFGWPVASMGREVRMRLGKPGLTIVGLAAAVLLADGLGFRAPFTELSRSLCFVAIMGAAFWVGVGFTVAQVTQRTLFFRHGDMLAVMLGVAVSTLADSYLALDSETGKLTISNLPPAAALNAQSADTRLRTAGIPWEFVQDASNHQTAVLAPLSFEGEQLRATLAEHRGLVSSIQPLSERESF